MASMKHAYSYVRFSTDKQEQGHSLERQTTAAEKYASKHGLLLDTSTYRDLGVSAFKSKNKDEGALGAFLTAVREGTIRQGSYLLVENFDRLSRDTVPVALELFLSITRAGITIVTLQDERVYSQESITANWVDLVVALSQMAAANAESEKKSQRLKGVWEKKRASGKPLTRICPSWLELVGDKFVIKEDKAHVVRRIYQLAYDGNGAPKIARILNEEKVPTMQWASEWTFALVYALLKHKAVIGTYVPKKAQAEEVPDYYPAIVEADLYWEVQNRIASRKWKGGRNADNVRNLFSGMTYCTCGSSMRSVGSDGKHTYLRCLSAYSNSGCEQGRFPYLALEKCLMARWQEQGRTLWAEEQRDAKLKINPRAALQGQKEDLEKKIARYVEALAEAGSVKAIAKMLEGLEQQLDDINKKLDEPEPESTAMLVIEAGERFIEYEHVKATGTPEEILKWRLQAQASIRRFLSRVEIDADRMGVVLTYASGKVREMDVRPFLEKVGGNRRVVQSSTP